MANKTKEVYVRRLRHWKQRFDKNSKFIWRKPIIWGGKKVKLGKPIPEDLENSPTKLRRFWESHTIELAMYEAPNVSTGQKQEDKPEFSFDIPEGVSIVKGKATWFIVTKDGAEQKLNGLRALEAYIAEISSAKDDTSSEGEDDSWLDDGAEEES